MRKIIVADDDFEQRDLYFELFKSAGFDVTGANDGADAWAKIHKDKPDLVFTGIMMPRMTGFELIEKMRNNPPTAKIPVIIFSHLGRVEDRARAASLPNVDFMLKGIDSPAKILRRVQDLLSSEEPIDGSVFRPDYEDDQGGVPMI